MGTLSRPKAEVVKALEELGYAEFGLYGWRYPVRTKHRPAATTGRPARPRDDSSAVSRDRELTVATAIGLAAVGATAAIAGFVTRDELHPSRGNAAAGLMVCALGMAAA